jgi:hypothetical protein
MPAETPPLSPEEIADLYDIALGYSDGNRDRARQLLEAYLAGRERLLPLKPQRTNP